jgi:hypothetical protein
LYTTHFGVYIVLCLFINKKIYSLWKKKLIVGLGVYARGWYTAVYNTIYRQYDSPPRLASRWRSNYLAMSQVLASVPFNVKWWRCVYSQRSFRRLVSGSISSLPRRQIIRIPATKSQNISSLCQTIINYYYCRKLYDIILLFDCAPNRFHVV